MNCYEPEGRKIAGTANQRYCGSLEGLREAMAEGVILEGWGARISGEKYQALLANETRYSRLTRAFPERAKQLFARNEQVANDRYEHLTRLVELYK